MCLFLLLMHFIQNSKYFYKKKHKNFIIYLLICDKVIGKGEFIFSLAQNVKSRATGNGE